MYNRYIPQPDGTYRRNRVADSAPSRPNPGPPPGHPQPSCSQERPPASNPPPPHPLQGGPIGTFLRQLLPRDFDTADLMIVLLLLLMAGDNEQERGTALLTLALYFVM